MRSVLSQLKRREAVLPRPFLLIKHQHSLLGDLVLDSHTDQWETEVRSHWNGLAQVE